VNTARGITFVEILAALMIFSTIITTGIMTLREARVAQEKFRLDDRAHHVLYEWLASQNTDDPMPAEFEDEDGVEWRVLEGTIVDLNIDIDRLLSATPDELAAMVEELGLGQRKEEPDEAETDEENPFGLPDKLIDVTWSVIRVDAKLPGWDESREIIRWRRLADASSNYQAPSYGGGSGSEADEAWEERLRQRGIDPDQINPDADRSSPTLQPAPRRQQMEQRRQPPSRRSSPVTSPTVPGQSRRNDQ
jgi:hypothetical protein